MAQQTLTVNGALIDKALRAKRESSRIEFKQTFDPDSKRDWCELIKDIIALANSGGGAILFGVDSKGQATPSGQLAITSIDPATIADRVHHYTGSHQCNVEVREVQKGGQNLVAWIVEDAKTPIVFSLPGTYPVDSGKQKNAFGQGTVYVRHGAKSEPATTEDLALFIDRRLESIRREWIGGVRKVVNAPAGSQVAVLPPDVTQSDSSDAAPIRITTDPDAPAYRIIDPDKTHPYRQKELIAEVGKSLPHGTTFNAFDVVAIRQVHEIDSRPEFAHHPKFGTRQYSQKFVEWVVARHHDDEEFFRKVRAKHQER